jgi:prepilin-type N-terminal cleavage/methylation domain-containing protein
MKKTYLCKRACLRKQGFTLIEILIVVAILAIILIIFFIALRNQIIKGNDMTRKTDLGKMQRMLEEYYNDKKTYPTVIDCQDTGFSPYLNKVPCDPVKKTPYFYISNVAGILTPKTGYVLCTNVEDRSDPDIRRIGCHPTAGCGWVEGYNYCITSGTTPVAPGYDPGDGDDEPIITSTPTPIPGGGGGDGESTPTPTPPWIYTNPSACTPGDTSSCNSYAEPIKAGCPFVYPVGCIYRGVYQCADPANRCTNY